MQRASCRPNGLDIAYLDTAPDASQRPLVLLLHGFPDESSMWTPQLEALHARGFRAVAPDIRGYGASALTRRVADSRLDAVVDDLVGLIDHLGAATADVAGHDWGAIFAWALAAKHPERVKRLAVLSVGHPNAYARAGIEQSLRAWYALMFQVPGLAERLLPLGDWRLLRGGMTAHPDADSVRAQMQRPGRLRAALNVYRANALALLRGGLPAVQADTLGIYSRADAFLTRRQMEQSQHHVRGRWRYVERPGGHWMPIEQPEAIAELLIDHFTADPD
ncbi:MAG: hypothetical protein CMH65_14830 [Nevskiales bacterium]|nr:hypothetical protein [Nevskiales bacterium]